MPEFKITCPHCGTVLAAQDDWIGMIMACPVCQKEFILQGPDKEAPAEKPCPFCGNEINAKAHRCKFCKRDLPQTEPPASTPQPPDVPTGPTVEKRRRIIIVASILAAAAVLAAVPVLYTIRGSNIARAAVTQGETVLKDPLASVAADEKIFEDTIGKLKEVSSKYPFISAAYKTQALIRRLESVRKEFTRIPSQDAVRNLKIDDPAAKPQITVRNINPGNDYHLRILPTDRKAEVKRIYREMTNFGTEFRKSEKHLKEANRLWAEVKRTYAMATASGVRAADKKSHLLSALDLSKRARNHADEAGQASRRAEKSHNKIQAWLLKESHQNTQTVILSPSKTCTLSGIRGPVILLAWENISYGDGVSSSHVRYKEYEPFAPETWILE